MAEIRGGADDYEEYYCPTIEWDWGDGTISENTQDCDPYEAGKSTIRRRFTTEHTYRMAGNFKVFFRLKRKDKTMGAASASVQVRPGLREQIGYESGTDSRGGQDDHGHAEARRPPRLRAAGGCTRIQAAASCRA